MNNYFLRRYFCNLPQEVPFLFSISFPLKHLKGEDEKSTAASRPEQMIKIEKIKNPTFIPYETNADSC